MRECQAMRKLKEVKETGRVYVKIERQRVGDGLRRNRLTSYC